MRRYWVLVHRWTGLVLFTFLVVAGTTGVALAWSDDLERMTAPAVFTTPKPVPGTPLLAPFTLRERVAAAHPEAEVTFVPLDNQPGIAASFFLSPRPGGPSLANDNVFVDPVTGRITGERRWGDISQGTRNLVPFLLRLHYGLALGPIGNWLFGIAALLWTIDCFVGAYLTFPVAARAAEQRFPRRRWWSRWGPAWRIRPSGGSHKLNFDLHRAGGLWLWAMLLIFAWSSVGFNLYPAYRTVTQALFGYHRIDDDLPDRAGGVPALSWRQAHRAARTAMASAAAREGLTVLNERRMALDIRKRVYFYRVRTSGELSLTGDTNLYLDADDGHVIGIDLPGRGPLGNSITRWIQALHMADAFGWPYRLFVSLLGGAVVMLSVTGIVIWNRKRSARRSGRRKAK